MPSFRTLRQGSDKLYAALSYATPIPSPDKGAEVQKAIEEAGRRCITGNAAPAERSARPRRRSRDLLDVTHGDRRAERSMRRRSAPPSPAAATALAGWLFISPALLLFLFFIPGPFVAAIGAQPVPLGPAHPPSSPAWTTSRQLVTTRPDPRRWATPSSSPSPPWSPTSGSGLLLALAVQPDMSEVLRTSSGRRVLLPVPDLLGGGGAALEVRARSDVRLCQLLPPCSASTPPNWFADAGLGAAALIVGRFLAHDRLHVHHHAGRAADGARADHEAARCDGANACRRFFSVTLPLMSPTMFFATVITFIGAFQIFDPMLIITNGGPDGATRAS